MWLLLLVNSSLAAEPQLDKTQASIGVSAQNIVLYGGALAPAVNPTLRVLLRERALVDITLNAGLERWTASDGEWSAPESGEAELDAFSGSEIRGPSVHLGVRAAWRVRGEGADGLYLGFAGSGGYERLRGPIFEDATDDTGTTASEEVGESSLQDRSAAAGASLVSVHWLSQRVAVSAYADAFLAHGQDSVSRRTLWEADAPDQVEERTSSMASLGFRPVLGLSLHLTLGP